LLARLYQLRKPKTNISIIQQNVLLKYKYFVRFVREHGEDVYQEVRLRGGGARPPSTARPRGGGRRACGPGLAGGEVAARVLRCDRDEPTTGALEAC
jgi:hypothetical protein